MLYVNGSQRLRLAHHPGEVFGHAESQVPDPAASQMAVLPLATSPEARVAVSATTWVNCDDWLQHLLVRAIRDRDGVTLTTACGRAFWPNVRPAKQVCETCAGLAEPGDASEERNA